MPGMDGFTVLKRMRDDAALRHVPVVVQTGREDVEAIDRCFHLGAASFVMKPLNWRLLTYQIRYVLRAERRATTERAVAAA
jgi:PleD family two-component response regulator